MQLRAIHSVVKIVILAAAIPALIFAYAEGPDAGLAGVPGEATCTACHSGSSGSGSVKVTFSGALYYAPGVKQHLVVTVTDSAQKRWGFELTARQASNSKNQAGSFIPSDSNSQIVCTQTSFQTERYGACASGMTLMYIVQTANGTRLNQKNAADFAFDWIPPASDIGDVVLYVAGNAANGDGSERGDHIYTAKYTVKIAPPAPTPPVISQNGVLNAASLTASASAGSWLVIQGNNLAGSTRGWTPADVVDSKLPQQLDNVTVTVNSKPAVVLSVSPTQLMVESPADDATGPVPVQVIYNGLTGDPLNVQLQPASPEFFAWSASLKYAVSTDPAVTTLPDLTKPPDTIPTVKSGDMVVLWGTGFGPATPAPPAGQLVPADQPYAATNPVTVMIGGVTTPVTSAVLAPGSAGIYQITVQIPDGLTPGDQPVTAQVAGISSTGTVNLSVVAPPPPAVTQ